VIRRYVELIGTPAVVIGGYVLFSGSHGLLADAWDGFIGPFLITFWIGLGFTTTWDVVRQELHGSSPKTLAIAGVGIGLFMLMMLGGPRVLLDDPWLFGAAVAPGFELALPWWRQHQAKGQQTTTGPALESSEDETTGA
jgi:hypothetical protein